MKPTAGYTTSEMHLAAVGLAYLWEVYGDRPELVIPWTGGILIAYLLARAAVKIWGKGDLVEQLPAGSAAAAKVAAPVATGVALALVLALPGCQALQNALLAPVGPQEATIQLPDGTQASGELVQPEPQPVEVPLPDGAGTVTYEPPQPEPGAVTTVLEAGAQAIAAPAAAVTGLPWLAFLIPTVAAGVASTLRRGKGK
jgi:hypothetical protein